MNTINFFRKCKNTDIYILIYHDDSDYRYDCMQLLICFECKKALIIQDLHNMARHGTAIYRIVVKIFALVSSHVKIRMKLLLYTPYDTRAQRLRTKHIFCRICLKSRSISKVALVFLWVNRVFICLFPTDPG